MVGRSEALFAPPSERGAQPAADGRPSLLSVQFAVIRAAARPALRLELDLDLLADEVATRVAARLADRIASQASSPWMAMDEAIAYTRIPAGTFRKLVAAESPRTAAAGSSFTATRSTRRSDTVASPLSRWSLTTLSRSCNRCPDARDQSAQIVEERNFQTHLSGRLVPAGDRGLSAINRPTRVLPEPVGGSSATSEWPT